MSSGLAPSPGTLTPASFAGAAYAGATAFDLPFRIITKQFVAGDFAGNDLAVYAGGTLAPSDLYVIYFMVMVSTAVGGACTGTFRSASGGGGTARSGSIDLNSVGLRRETAAVASAANRAVSAGSSLYLRTTAGPGAVVGSVVLIARGNA